MKTEAIYPDQCTWEWRDRLPNVAIRKKVISLFEKLADFNPSDWGATHPGDAIKFPCFSFDEEAQEIFIKFSTHLHLEIIPMETNPLISQHLEKYDKLFPAIALIFHLVDCAEHGYRGPISAQSAIKALAWCKYLEEHARRSYGLLADDGLRAAQALAEKIQKGILTDGITARIVKRNQWTYLTNNNAVQAALEWLEDEGWLRPYTTGGNGPGMGRRTYKYAINPKIFSTPM